MADPLYQQIANDLRRRIDSGELMPGSQLPTELELRETYEASRNTVRDAIKRLMILGLVETRPGQGTFVTQRIVPFTFVLLAGDLDGEDRSELDAYASKAESVGRHLDLSAPKVEIQRASAELAMQLGITEGHAVISRQQRLTIDEIPWAIQTIFYPMQFVNEGALRLIETVNFEEGVLAYLKEIIGVTQASWRDVIQTRTPDSTEIDFFPLREEGQGAVFEIRRTGFDGKGHPMRLSVTIFPTDRNVFVYQAGPVPGRTGDP